jgi:acyl-CoA thioester hydrolase
MARTDFKLAHPLRVRWAEVDPQSIVFNAHYLAYFDVGVTEYWRAIGCVYPEGFESMGVDSFAVKATLEYHASARYDDMLELCTRVSKLGRTSMRVAFEIHRGSDHLVTGELIYVIADLKTRKPVPIPDALKAKILGYEITPPEQ